MAKSKSAFSPGTGPQRAKAPASNKAPSGPKTLPNSGLAKVQSGGGLQSNKRVTPQHVGGMAQTRKVSVNQVMNIGTSVGNHPTDGRGIVQRPNVPLYQPAAAAAQMGNEVAKNVGRGGPGAGRTVYRSGSQSPSPTVGAPQGGRDILSQFGPESTGRKG